MEEENDLTKKEKRELARERKKEETEKKQTANSFRKFAIWILTAGIIAFVGLKVVNWIRQPEPQVAGESIKVKEGDWVKGPENARVTLLEYADFQCPACADYYPLTKKLSEEFPNDLKIVYRHYPLVTIHKNAIPAAKASEAAGRQGKFWEMHDILYEKQTEWANEINPFDKFISYSGELGLDEAKFREDYNLGEIEKKINDSYYEAVAIRINSTPTFFLNEKQIAPVASYDELKSLVVNQLNQ